MGVCLLCVCVCVCVCVRARARACALSGRGVYDGLITRQGVSYLLCVCVCVCVCDLETSEMRQPWPTLGCCAREEEENFFKALNTVHFCH